MIQLYFAFGIAYGNILIVEGDELKKWREANAFTREELARLLKTSFTTVFRWEKGERSIPPYLELALKQIEGTINTERKNV